MQCPCTGCAAPASACRNVLDQEACASLRLHVGKPCFLQFLQVVLTTLLAASIVKTNPEPDKPLALKSRVVVEFTAAEGLVTRNKSSSPVFR